MQAHAHHQLHAGADYESDLVLATCQKLQHNMCLVNKHNHMLLIWQE